MNNAGATRADRSRADAIQEAVISRAAELGMTAYAIAKATDGAVTETHVRDYMQRRSSMGSHKLQHVLTALGLVIVAGRKNIP